MPRLADRRVALESVDPIADETVRTTLKKTPSRRGGSGTGAFRRRRTGACVAAMEDVRAPDPRDFAADAVRVCMDETSRQQTQETRVPGPARNGGRSTTRRSTGAGGTARRWREAQGPARAGTAAVPTAGRWAGRRRPGPNGGTGKEPPWTGASRRRTRG